MKFPFSLSTRKKTGSASTAKSRLQTIILEDKETPEDRFLKSLKNSIPEIEKIVSRAFLQKTPAITIFSKEKHQKKNALVTIRCIISQQVSA